LDFQTTGRRAKKGDSPHEEQGFLTSLTIMTHFSLISFYTRARAGER